MATWKISNYHKKNAVEIQFWTKGDKMIIREEGFRWGIWYCESDERPDVDLKNEDGYEIGCSDYEWELEMMDDGSWAETRTGNDNTTDEDLEEFEAAWEEDSFCGVEEQGWINDDTEFWIYGPIELANEQTGESWNGDTDEHSA